MDNTEILRIAEEVSREATTAVRAYIDIQNSIFKFSFKKFFGFKGTEPETAAANAVVVREKVEALLEKIRELKLDASDRVGDYCITLRAYLRTLEEAIDGFIVFCGKMQSARNDKHSKYWKTDYKNDLEAFQLKETDYMKIGFDLNDRWAIIKKGEQK